MVTLRPESRPAIYAACLIASFGPSTFAQPQSPLPEAAQAAMLIEGKWINSSGSASCQGFFVGDKHFFVTAWHVCATHNPMWLNLGPKGCFPVEAVLAADEVADCIVLRIRDVPQDVPTLKLCTTPPTEGDTLLDIRRRPDGTTTFTPLECLENTDTSIRQSLRIRGEVRLGFSGSALIDSTGCAVGLVFGGGPAWETDSDAASWLTIADLLHRAEQSAGQSYAGWRKKSFGTSPEETYAKSQAMITAYHERNYESCVKLARETLDANPNSLMALDYGFSAMKNLGRSDDQRMAWVMERASDSGESWLSNRLIGDLLMNARRFADAANFYKLSLAIEPRFSTQYWLASSLHLQGHDADAIAMLKEAATKWPGHASAYAQIRSWASSSHDAAEVRSATQSLLAMNPRSPDWIIANAAWLVYIDNRDQLKTLQQSLWESNPYVAGHIAMYISATKTNSTLGGLAVPLPVYRGPKSDIDDPSKQPTP